MKTKLPHTILLLFLISTTFQSDNPPGWFEQQLPRDSIIVQDIFFIDSLKGWVSARKVTNDTAFIFRTNDGGNNWITQFKDSIRWVNAIQFLDENTGYAGGGFGRAKFLKTSNGGINWQIDTPFGSGLYSIIDLKFVNKDTGWICSDESINGGIFRTTNGGTNWVRQLDPSSRPLKLFFLNADTGWAINQTTLYKTSNGGVNWFNLNSFPIGLRGLYFLNNDTGWIIRQAGQNSIIKTTNGGINWTVQSFNNPFGTPQDLYIQSNKKGWVSTVGIHSLVNDSVWGTQQVPFASYNSIIMSDTNIGYAGGNIFIKTEDGGGPIMSIQQISAEIPEGYKLYQNYPNPFNSSTKIKFSIPDRSEVKLMLYDIKGSRIKELVSGNYTAGEYEYTFEADGLSSGVYFYVLQSEDVLLTKKLIFSK